MTSGQDKTERSYLSSAIESINPWNPGRPATAIQGDRNQKPEEPPKPPLQTPAEDHSTTPFYGQSLRSYPPDCPELTVRWYHAVDVPKRKPVLVKSRQAAQAEARLPAQPKKFVAFPLSDSRRIENGYQRQLEIAEDKRGRSRLAPRLLGDAGGGERAAAASSFGSASTAITNARVLIPVQEDFLFDVDVEKRELCPVYWYGPIYEVRRGTWFYQEGSSLRPCEENLASQLEEGYLKLRPWTSGGSSRTRPGPGSQTPDAKVLPLTKAQTEPSQAKSLPSQAATAKATPTVSTPPLPSYRLFGAYMNNIATYQDASIAWLTSDNMLSWVATSVYEKFAGGGHLSGVKLLRGYSEIHKSREGGGERAEKDDPPAASDNQTERQSKGGTGSSRSTPPPIRRGDARGQGQVSPSVGRAAPGLRQSRGTSPDGGEDITRLAAEDVGDDDEAGGDDDDGGREIDHLILVTHGIGQRMGLRMESINFVNDVDVLRRTIKSVYSHSADLVNLTSEFGHEQGNCRVQVLPVCWRHKVEFPRARASKLERDLGVTAKEEEDPYPSLEDITVEGVAFARSLISDLALDVLLYQSSYRGEIAQIVLEESNRIFQLFIERNTGFCGKIHLMGHSLGSAILFDILCQQKSRGAAPGSGQSTLLFDVDDFYCLGSPVGLFQMLRGSTIAARSSVTMPPTSSPQFGDDDPDCTASSTSGSAPPPGLSSPNVSSPAVAQLFNIFHPSDPISYRLEPLVSPAMTALKPQPLPYTKRGLFGSVAPQGLTSIGAKVGQSVSGLWSSLSAGIASNILKSSLGLGADEMMDVSRQQIEAKDDAARAGGLGHSGDHTPEDRERQMLSDYLAVQSQNAISRARETSSGDEFETLCSIKKGGKASASKQRDRDYERKKLRIEENKVRKLNRNGRIDYSIQESALDFNPINAIASHMSYWADEDVCHFLLSQLLIRGSTDGREKLTKFESSAPSWQGS